MEIIAVIFLMLFAFTVKGCMDSDELKHNVSLEKPFELYGKERKCELTGKQKKLDAINEEYTKVKNDIPL